MNMTLDLWNQIKYFSPEEKWGDPFKMSSDFMFKLDAFREFCNKPIIIHTGYATSGHSSTSMHYQGKAADLHIEGLTLLEQLEYAIKFEFNGIGLYPDWNNVGLHLDIRDIPYRWIRKNNQYINLNTFLLRSL